MIFATLVTSTYETLGIKPKKFKDRNYSVFGDDIICVESAYDVICSVLNGCGFIVNSEKSYNIGGFRESCGSDFWYGHDVRGVYIKEIKNEQDVYSAFNRLSRWSAKHNINLSAVLSYLKGLVDFLPIPYDAGDSEGIKCPSRYLESEHAKFDRNGARYYRALIAKTSQRVLKPAEIAYNFDACVIACIGGYVRDKKYGFRVNKPSFKIVKRKTPRWDYVTDVGLTIQDYQTLWSLL